MASEWFEWEYQPGAVWGYDTRYAAKWNDPGFLSPEEAASAGFPSRFVRVESVEYHPDGNHAVVELLTNEEPSMHPYTVLCARDTSGRWHEDHGHGHN